LTFCSLQTWCRLSQRAVVFGKTTLGEATQQMKKQWNRGLQSKQQSFRLVRLLWRRSEACHRLAGAHKINPLAAIDLMKIAAKMDSLK
jgi:hypothetical protein